MDRRKRTARTVALMSLFTMTDTQTDVPIASFDGDGSDLISLIVGIEPVQDLNGYSNPWPAGGGKNIYPNSSISGEGSGVTVVHNSTDESYTVSGLSTAYRGFSASSGFTLKAGAYTLSRTASSDSVSDNNLRMELRSMDGLTTYASSVGTGGFTLAEDTEVKARIVAGQGDVDFGTGITYRFQIESGSTATAWLPYSNICPISGHSSVNVIVSPTLNPLDGTTYSITFPSSAGTVYGGTLDVTTGKLMVTDGYIASYNGETLPSTWISDRDVYAIGANPTTGAEVVYKLATPIVYDLTPTEINTLLGANNIWADTGEIKYIEYNV